MLNFQYKPIPATIKMKTMLQKKNIYSCISHISNNIFIPDGAVVASIVAAIAVSAETFVGAPIVIWSDNEQIVIVTSS